MLLWPIASAIILGLIFAYAFYPVFGAVVKIVREKNISSLIVVIIAILIIFIPVWFILPIMANQIFNVYLLSQNINFGTLLAQLFPSDNSVSPDLIIYLNSFVTSLASKLLSSFSVGLINLAPLALKAVVFIFVFFFGLRDGDIFLNYAKGLSPFSKSAETEIASKFKGITQSVIYGFIVVGLIQGLMTGIGLFLAGVPNSILLTLLAIFASIVPILGAWMIWAPASAFLLISGHTLAGIALGIYGAVVISWIDNILRSYWVAKKVKISSAIVLIGMIGGLIVFGFLGLVIGPLILVYLVLLLDAYRNKKIPGLFSFGRTVKNIP